MPERTSAQRMARRAACGCRLSSSVFAFLAHSELSTRFRPPRRRPSYFSLHAQREVTKRKGTRLWRRTSSGALRCSPVSGRRELAHPCARTCAPFPRARLRCSAPETGGESQEQQRASPCSLLRLLRPVDRGAGPEDQSARAARAQSPGVFFLDYFSLHEQREVTRPPLRRTKPRDTTASRE